MRFSASVLEPLAVRKGKIFPTLVITLLFPASYSFAHGPMPVGIVYPYIRVIFHQGLFQLPVYLLSLLNFHFFFALFNQFDYLRDVAPAVVKAPLWMIETVAHHIRFLDIGPSAVRHIIFKIFGTIITAESLWGLYLFGALGVSSAWALSTLLPGLVTVTAEPEIHGRVFGMLHLLWTFAMILGTLLGGALLEIDMRLPFAIVGILNLIALALTVPFFQMQSIKPKTT